MAVGDLLRFRQPNLNGTFQNSYQSFSIFHGSVGIDPPYPGDPEIPHTAVAAGTGQYIAIAVDKIQIFAKYLGVSTGTTFDVWQWSGTSWTVIGTGYGDGSLIGGKSANSIPIFLFKFNFSGDSRQEVSLFCNIPDYTEVQGQKIYYFNRVSTAFVKSSTVPISGDIASLLSSAGYKTNSGVLITNAAHYTNQLMTN